MKLGTYTFEIAPDQFTLPRPEKFSSEMMTYSSVDYFSWGLSIIGKNILVESEKMTLDQFNRLDILFQADASVVWDPEITKKIFHGAVVNGPLVVGRTLTGSPSTATGMISAVYSGENYVEIVPLTGIFLAGDALTDNSSPAKTSTITSYENVGTFTVEIKSLDGKYVDPGNPGLAFRQDVKMILLILAVL
jgi:hypothetical protein